MPVPDEDEDLHWHKPMGKRVFHIYNEDGRSLCGKYAALATLDQPVEDDAEYMEGDDCKSCSRKAGLIE